MLFFKKLLDFYIKTSLHVAFAVFCLVKITNFELQINEYNFYSLLVFFGTIVSYNLLKYFEFFSNNSWNFNKHKAILGVTFLAIIGYSYLFFKQKSNVQIHLIEVGILVLVYPFLRKYAILKISLVALCVAIISVQIPYLGMKFLSFDYYINFVQRFIFVLIWIIPFEIYDSKTDATTLNTIVQKYGIKRSKLIGMLLVIPFLILEFLKLNYSFSIILIAIALVLFLNFSSVKRNEYYTSFWVESIPIFWWILFLILKRFIF
ncbi:hypothetical protein OX283_007655 [Flavobacterium sp. SUN052]|uniref:hypothetical protein n=1 Tax=Flavobacterium sp. SUN052 TaxID=3002441 RepID=UPI00237E8AA8|nr:hypothetical protein [Flavobacterium sp. SUN052]MEC4004528.1 hypothetical protein [Flavobacterium sp. SUN052]